jgi:hypothetical protein
MLASSCGWPAPPREETVQELLRAVALGMCSNPRISSSKRAITATEGWTVRFRPTCPLELASPAGEEQRREMVPPAAPRAGPDTGCGYRSSDALEARGPAVLEEYPLGPEAGEEQRAPLSAGGR